MGCANVKVVTEYAAKWFLNSDPASPSPQPQIYEGILDENRSRQRL